MGKLFQHGTIGALMAGQLAGSLSLEALSEHGNMGIGTLHSFDGELVILDGTPYQITSDGTVGEVNGKVKTPYAAVIDFEQEGALKIEEAMTAEQLKEQLLAHFSSQNTFQAVRVTGQFKQMHCRAVAKQTPPYPRPAEVSSEQGEFVAENITGTIVGFFTPEAFGTLAVPHFHLHFLNDDRDFGGHVYDFHLEKGTAAWQTVETLEQHFPVENEQYMQSTIDYSQLEADIETSE